MQVDGEKNFSTNDLAKIAIFIEKVSNVILARLCRRMGIDRNVDGKRQREGNDLWSRTQRERERDVRSFGNSGKRIRSFGPGWFVFV